MARVQRGEDPGQAAVNLNRGPTWRVGSDGSAARGDSIFLPSHLLFSHQTFPHQTFPHPRRSLTLAWIAGVTPPSPSADRPCGSEQACDAGAASGLGREWVLDRRGALKFGLAATGGWLAVGCGGEQAGGPPPARVDRQRRPATSSQLDPRPAPPTSEPEVRVRLASLRQGEALSVEVEGRWLRLEDEGQGGGAVFDGTLRIESTSDGWRLVPERGPVLRLPRGRLECGPVPGEPSRMRVGWAGREAISLPGRVALVPTERTPVEGSRRPEDRRPSTDLVSIKRIESYLPGVLAKELYGHWSPGCFRAQAVAARSFALCEAAHWRHRRHYDLTAGPDTQAWEAIDPNAPSSGPETDAVEATRGLVLSWSGLVVPAYFSSCCGGWPATARDAIGSNPANAIEPLEGRRDGDPCCESAPTFRWRRQASTPEIARGLSAWALRQGRRDAVDLATLREVDVLEVNRHGRPVAFELTDRSGRRDAWSAETFRRALAAAMPTGSKPVYSSAIEPEIDLASARFAGRGHGHGVGLCQYGAEAMASRGAAAERILERYYPGAWIHSAWS